MNCPKCGTQVGETVEQLIQAVDGSIVEPEDGWYAMPNELFAHGCCDCGLFHQVEYALTDDQGETVDMPEGAMLALRFTRDNGETEVLRNLKKIRFTRDEAETANLRKQKGVFLPVSSTTIEGSR